MIDISRGYKQVSLPDDFVQTAWVIEDYYDVLSINVLKSLSKKVSNSIKVVHFCISPLKYETDLNVYEAVNTLELLWLNILLSDILLALDRKKEVQT